MWSKKNAEFHTMQIPLPTYLFKAWCLYKMVAQRTLQACDEIRPFFENISKLEANNCLQQIKYIISPHVCAP